MSQKDLRKLYEQLRSGKKRMAKAHGNQHIHQFTRINIAKKPGKTYLVYRCGLPNCPYYAVPELIIGKLSICPHCDTAFEIRRAHLELVTPHCDECKDPTHWLNRKEKPVKASIEIAEAFADLLLKSQQAK